MKAQARRTATHFTPLNSSRASPRRYADSISPRLQETNRYSEASKPALRALGSKSFSIGSSAPTTRPTPLGSRPVREKLECGCEGNHLSLAIPVVDFQSVLRIGLSAILSQTEAKNDEIEEKLRRVAERLNLCVKKTEGLQRKTTYALPAKSTRAEITSLRLKVKQLNYIKSQLENTIEKVAQEAMDGKRELERVKGVELAHFMLQREFLTLEQSYFLATSKLKHRSNAEKGAERLKKELVDTQEELRLQRLECSSLLRQLSQKTEEETRLTNFVKSVKSQLTVAEVETQNLKGEMMEIRKLLDRNVKRNVELEETVKECKEKERRDEESMRKLRKEVEMLREQLDASRTEIADFQCSSLLSPDHSESIVPLQVQISSLLKDLRDSKEHYSLLESELSHRKPLQMTDGDDRIGELRSCQADLQHLEWKFAEVKQSLANWQSVYSAAVDRCCVLQSLAAQLPKSDVAMEIECGLKAIVAISASLQQVSKGHYRSHSAVITAVASREELQGCSRSVLKLSDIEEDSDDRPWETSRSVDI